MKRLLLLCLLTAQSIFAADDDVAPQSIQKALDAFHSGDFPSVAPLCDAALRTLPATPDTEQDRIFLMLLKADAGLESGYMTNALKQYDEALLLSRKMTTSAPLQMALERMASLMLRTDRPADATGLIGEGLRLSAASGDSASRVSFLKLEESRLQSLGNTTDAARISEQIVSVSRTSGDAGLLANSLVSLCEIRIEQNKTEDIESLLSEALRVAKRSDNPAITIRTLLGAARIQSQLFHHKETLSLFDEARNLAIETRDPSLAVEMLHTSADIALINSHPSLAEKPLNDAMTIGTKSRMTDFLLDNHILRGHMFATIGDTRKALESYRSARDTALQKYRIATAFSLQENIADILLEQANRNEAEKAYKSIITASNDIPLKKRVADKLKKMQGNLASYRDILQEELKEHTEGAMTDRSRSMLQLNIAQSITLLGDYRASATLLLKLFKKFKDDGDWYGAFSAQYEMSRTLLLAGDIKNSLIIANQCLVILQDKQLAGDYLSVLAILCELHLRSGNITEAQLVAVKGKEYSDTIQDTYYRHTFMAYQSALSYHANPAESYRNLEEAIRFFTRNKYYSQAVNTAIILGISSRSQNEFKGTDLLLSALQIAEKKKYHYGTQALLQLMIKGYAEKNRENPDTYRKRLESLTPYEHGDATWL